MRSQSFLSIRNSTDTMSSEGTTDAENVAIVMARFNLHSNVAEFVRAVDVVLNRPDLDHGKRLVKVIYSHVTPNDTLELLKKAFGGVKAIPGDVLSSPFR